MYEEPPSEYSTLSLLSAIRDYLWPEECLQNARHALTQGLKRINKNGNASIVITENHTKENYIEEGYVKRLQKQSGDWYPDCWFAFLAMGKASGSDNICAFLNSGLPTKNVAVTLCPPSIGVHFLVKKFLKLVIERDGRKLAYARKINEQQQSSTPSKTSNNKMKFTPPSQMIGSNSKMPKCKMFNLKNAEYHC
jgi:hypothetical protein